jgi:hypothetical protein
LVKSKAHDIAIDIEKSKDDCDVELVDVVEGTKKQLRVDVLTKSTSREAYHRLLITAYEMALHPSMSLSNFEVLIKIQRMNGVRFISGECMSIL